MRLSPAKLLCALACLAAVAGCGANQADRATRSEATASAPAVGAPALALRPPAPGEIVVRGEASPKRHGPYAFGGRYLVRFEQYAPEDPDLDFASQTSLTAALTRREGDPRGSVAVVEAAARSGRRELEIRGRYYVDVSFGDYPYVIRFTPRGGS